MHAIRILRRRCGFLEPLEARSLTQCPLRSLAARIYGSFRENNGHELGFGSDWVRRLMPLCGRKRPAHRAEIPQCSRLLANPPWW
jgi:hypothetical protein